MDRVAQRGEYTFSKAFGQGRVDVDGARHIFQRRAHLQRQGELARQFGDMLADGVNAQDHMIALTRGDAHKAAISAAFHGQRPARSRQRELAGDDGFTLGLGFIRRQANADEFGFGEADGGDGDRIISALVIRR